jgi:hypothetical protein
MSLWNEQIGSEDGIFCSQKVSLERPTQIPMTNSRRWSYCQMLWMRFDSGGVLYLDSVDEFGSRNHGLEVG